MQNQKIILGIDPGSRKVGYGLIAVSGKQFKYIASGTISHESKDLFERYQFIQIELQKIISAFNPDEIAMESLIYVKSPTALIKLAQARGIILSTFIQKYSTKFFEYSPNLVKSTSVGHGHADKEGVQKAISMYLGVKTFKSDDESDALAVCLCHALNHGRVIVSTKKSKGKSLSSQLAHKVKEI